MRFRRAVFALALLGCGAATREPPRTGAGAPTRPKAAIAPPAAAPAKAAPTPCDRARAMRAKVAGLRDQGKIDRARRTIEAADALCPADARATRATMLALLVDLGRDEDAATLASAIASAGDASDADRAAAADARRALSERPPIPSGADAEAARREAEALLAEGDDAYARQDVARARDAYRKSWTAFRPNGGALIGLALVSADAIESQRAFDRAAVEIERETGAPLRPAALDGAASIAAIWSKSGKLLAIPDATGTVVIARPATRDRLLRLASDTPSITGLWFSDDDGRLLVARAGELETWDLRSGRQVGSRAWSDLPPRALDGDLARAAVVHAKVGDTPAYVALDPPPPGAAPMSVKGTDAVHAVGFASPTELVAIDQTSAKQESRESRPRPTAQDPAARHDFVITTTTATASVRRWSISTGAVASAAPLFRTTCRMAAEETPIRLPRGYRGPAPRPYLGTPQVDDCETVRTVALSADTRTAAVAVVRATPQRSTTRVEVYDLATGARLATLPDVDPVGRLVVSSRRIAIGASAGGWRVHELPSGAPRCPVSTTGTVTGIAPDGVSVAVVEDGHATVFDTRADCVPGARIDALSSAEVGNVAAVAGRVAVVAGGSQGRGKAALRLLDVAGAAVRTIDPRVLAAGAVAFSPDGSTIAVAADGEAHLVDPSGARAVVSLDTGKSSPTDLAFAPDGATVAAAAGSKDVLVWNVATGLRGKSIATSGRRDRCTSVAFAPSRAILAAGFTDGVELVDLASDAEPVRVRGLEEPIRRLRFTGDGALVVLGTNGLIGVAPDHWAPRFHVGTSREGLLALSASSDDDGVVVSDARGALSLFDADDGTQRATVHVTDLATALSLSGSALLSAERTALRVRDPKTGAVRATVYFAPAGDGALVVDDEENVEPIGSPPLACAAGPRLYPFAACAERWTKPGTLARAMRGEPAPDDEL